MISERPERRGRHEEAYSCNRNHVLRNRSDNGACSLRRFVFKGNRKNAECGIPRKARHRSGPQDWRERICILTGINVAGDIFFEMTGRGNMSEEQAGRFLAGKVASGAIVSTDKAKSYRRALRDLDVRRHEAHALPVLRILGQAGEMGFQGPRGAAAGHGGGRIQSGLTCPSYGTRGGLPPGYRLLCKKKARKDSAMGASRLTDLYLQRIEIDGDIPGNSYIARLPVVRSIMDSGGLDLSRPVTILVGENGVGKSTLVEAIAIRMGFNPEGGSVNFNFSTRESHSPLHEYLRLIKGCRWRKDGFYLRAESFYNVASNIDDLGVVGNYGQVSLHR